METDTINGRFASIVFRESVTVHSLFATIVLTTAPYLAQFSRSLHAYRRSRAQFLLRFSLGRFAPHCYQPETPDISVNDQRLRIQRCTWSCIVHRPARPIVIIGFTPRNPV